MSAAHDLESGFARACDRLLGELAGGEAASLEFAGEVATFLRFNTGRVRQIGEVSRSEVYLKLFRDGRTLSSSVSLSGDEGVDGERMAAALTAARREIGLLPEDPYQALPAVSGCSREEFAGHLPDPDGLPAAVLAPARSMADLGAEYVGFHAQGPICRGAANSAGARHWFATETFATDYSAYLPNGKATKGCYAGRQWDEAEYRRRLDAERPRLQALAQPERRLRPGQYRAYLTPQALSEFMPFFSWHGLSERQLREGESAWLALREGRCSLAPGLRLTQDFGLGVEPRFNELGEMAPPHLVLIEAGGIANTLVSARTSRQYGVESNAAPEWEGLRSGCLDPGDLDEDRALEALGTGLYLPNLHYLNWSDFDSARITGMTRFACFWIEEGRLAAPIEDMRFDESLYHLWSEKLLGLSRQRSLIVDTGTYFHRSLGGALLPGMLVDGLTFTL